MPEDDDLREGLGRLRPEVDQTTGLDNVMRESSRRNRRDRVAAAVTVVVVLVLAVGVAFGVGRDGSGRDADVAAVGRGTVPGTAATSILGTDVAVTSRGTEPPGTIRESPPSTATSLPPPTAPTTVVPAVPPLTGAGKPDIEMVLRPAATTVSLGDRLLVDVRVTNRGTEPAYYDSNFCGRGPGSVFVAEREGLDPSTIPRAPEWDGDPNGYERMRAANDFRGGEYLVETRLVESPPSDACAAFLGNGVLAGGESISGQLAWEVHLGPEELPTPGTLFVSGSFLYGSTSGSYNAQAARATTTVHLIDDPRRTTTGPAAYTAAASDPLVTSYVRDVLPRSVSFWFGRNEWVLLVTGNPTMAENTIVVVRVDPDTGIVRSAERLPATAQPRL
jgi:hypothetical protein